MLLSGMSEPEPVRFPLRRQVLQKTALSMRLKRKTKPLICWSRINENSEQTILRSSKDWPEALEGLPAPTHAFIGGSSGNLKEILEVLLEQNPRVRVVINAIALETVAEAMQCLKSMAFTDVDIAQVSVAKGKKLGSYEMMMGQNPVYIFSCTGGEIA